MQGIGGNFALNDSLLDMEDIGVVLPNYVSNLLGEAIGELRKVQLVSNTGLKILRFKTKEEKKRKKRKKTTKYKDNDRKEKTENKK